MALQLYYTPQFTEGAYMLPIDLAHHVANVMRMRAGETLMLTNGLGLHAIATIQEVSKKQTVVNISEMQRHTPPRHTINLAISFTKNASRMEWLLEKITEIGVANIFPIITERTEKVHFKSARFQKIIESAMCQSMQYFLPVLHEPISFKIFLETNPHQQNFIAHCLNTESKTPLHDAHDEKQDVLICIGPEGDFTPSEIEQCIAMNYKPVSLGNTRLRTETAGLVALALLNNK